MPLDWESVREVWERDNRPGFTWLCKEQGITQTPQAVRKRADREGWTKHEAASATEKHKAKPKDSNRKRVTAKKGDKAIAPQAKDGLEGENEESSTAQAPVENDTLTVREKVFVAEYLKDFNASRACRAAGLSAHNPNRSLRRPAVQAAIRAAIEKRCFALGVDADALMKLLADIVACDVGELMPIRRIPCPYCWSENGAPQMTMERYEKERAQHNRLRLKMLGGPDSEDIGEFPPATAFTFVDPNAAPNADCAVCHGEGQVYAPPPDTSTLSPGARQLYGGYVLTKEGPQVIVRAKDKATEMLAKALGLFAEKEDEKEIVTAVSAEELLRIYDERMKLAHERQAAVDRERGLK